MGSFAPSQAFEEDSKLWLSHLELRLFRALGR
jgi:hypothetical protein